MRRAWEALRPAAPVGLAVASALAGCTPGTPVPTGAGLSPAMHWVQLGVVGAAMALASLTGLAAVPVDSR